MILSDFSGPSTMTQPWPSSGYDAQTAETPRQRREPWTWTGLLGLPVHLWRTGFPSPFFHTGNQRTKW